MATINSRQRIHRFVSDLVLEKLPWPFHRYIAGCDYVSSPVGGHVFFYVFFFLFFLTYGSGRGLKQFRRGSRDTVNLKNSCKVSGITDPPNLKYWCGTLTHGSQEKGEREGGREKAISAD